MAPVPALKFPALFSGAEGKGDFYIDIQTSLAGKSRKPFYNY